MIHLYTGNGKGKTTAAFGLAMRSVGHGGRVLVIQFMKSRICGEHIAALRLEPELTVERMGPDVSDSVWTDSTRARWVDAAEPLGDDIDAAGLARDRAKDAILSGDYDMVVLDEIISAVSCGLLAEDDVINLMRLVPAEVELVLTGNPAPEPIRHMADLVTDMRSEKHYFDRGVAARKGIEF